MRHTKYTKDIQSKLQHRHYKRNCYKHTNTNCPSPFCQSHGLNSCATQRMCFRALQVKARPSERTMYDAAALHVSSALGDHDSAGHVRDHNRAGARRTRSRDLRRAREAHPYLKHQTRPSCDVHPARCLCFV